MKKTRALCVYIALSLAACGGSPTDTIPSGVTGTWEGQLQDATAPTQVTLSLVQAAADSIGGTGELRSSGGPPQALEISSGTIRDGQLTLIIGRPGSTSLEWTFDAPASPGQDELLGTFTDHPHRRQWKLWLVRQ